MKAALEAPSGRGSCRWALVRVNLGQEAMAFQLAGSPDGLFPEPVALADALTLQFRRFVPLFDGT